MIRGLANFKFLKSVCTVRIIRWTQITTVGVEHTSSVLKRCYEKNKLLNG